ncbi:hypothetical protein QP446_04195 [Corynebacterium riegelii]|uniref:hypothetical protein n=1 Tax=Corynebacterium riegelii TaxID=156976 RepID=UPI002550025A|nr:hypothetical protein [Corynebacterium riegelii]MDK7179969.1 hypothetical protein [Corynebacterium riegelii]
MSIKLVADGGEITVGARVAVYTYGAFNVVLPEGRELAQDGYTDDGYTNGYVYRPPGTEKLGRFDIAFARADVTVETNAGYSNFEAVVDASQRKVAEDVYFERDITGAGLGAWTPGEDYQVGDIVDVLVFNRVIPQPVTAITYTSSSDDPLGVRVHVGGQTIRDAELLEEQNRSVREAIAQESAQRRKQVGAVQAQARTAETQAAQARKAADKAVVDTVVEYAKSPSGTQPPSSGWSQAAPEPSTVGFVWQRTITWFGDGRVERGPAVLVTGNTGLPGPRGPQGDPGPQGATGARGPQGPQGAKGDTGSDGAPGKNGVGVQQTTVTYAQSASGVTAPSSGWQAQPPANVPAGRFVWTKMVLHYTDNSTEEVFSVGKIGETGPQGAPGEKGATGARGPQGAPGPKGAKGDTGSDGRPGKDGTKLVSTVVTYSQSTSGTQPPTQGWQSQPPTVTPGRFVWTRFVWSYSDGTSETGYSVGKIGETGARGPQGPQGATGPQGAPGPKGQTGAQGVSVKDVTHFWQWATSKPATPTGNGNPSGWSTTQPAYKVGQTLYTTIRTTYSNGSVSWAPTTEEASVSAATAISNESANSKNRVWYATSAPGNTRGEREGDTWFRYSGTTIIGQWRWTGSSWATQTLGNQVIANLDAGKITSGTIDARRIAADSITVNELRAGTIVPIGGSLIHHEPKVSGGVPEPIWWQVCNQALPAGYSGWPRPEGHPWRMYSKAQKKYAYQAPPKRLVKVQPGQKYRLQFWCRATVANTKMSIEIRDQNGAYAVKSGSVKGTVNNGNYKTAKEAKQPWPVTDFSDSSASGYLVGFFTVPTETTKVVSTIEFKEGVEYVYLDVFRFNLLDGAQGDLWIAGLSLELDIPDQAQIDALQTKQITDNSNRIREIKEAQDKAQQAIDAEEKYRMHFGSGLNSGKWFSPKRNSFVEVSTFRPAGHVKYSATRARLKRDCKGYMVLMQNTEDGLMDIGSWDVNHKKGETFYVRGGLNKVVREWVIMYQLY